MALNIFAPAKINLSLHVTGQRDDGYHLLDSLVAFADVGDDLVLSKGQATELSVLGPESANVPTDPSNLILKVAALFDDVTDVRFELTKNLPVASGIGGGSADAAAAFRGLLAVQSQTTGESPNVETAMTALLALGADIPMCVTSSAARISGVGEVIDPLVSLPELNAVLVNPRCSVATPDVFKSLTEKNNPSMPARISQIVSAQELFHFLAAQRNDLEDAARRLVPEIDVVKTALQKDPGCRLARMSGSGATCFALFETRRAARKAAEDLRQTHPDWWVVATVLGSQAKAAGARVT